MSNIAMAGGSTGSGTVTLLAPSTSTNRTLTLPDSTGTVLTTGSTAVVTPAMLTQPLTSGTAVASTSGTSIDFTGLPSWVKRITVLFNGVSTNGTSGFLIQLGTSGGVQITSYDSLGNRFDTATGQGGLSSTAGFVIARSTAADSLLGAMQVCSMSSTDWAENHAGKLSASNAVCGGGAMTLTGTLDRVRVTTVNGTDTFDAGLVNILYEG